MRIESDIIFCPIFSSNEFKFMGSTACEKSNGIFFFLNYLRLRHYFKLILSLFFQSNFLYFIKHITLFI